MKKLPLFLAVFASLLLMGCENQGGFRETAAAETVQAAEANTETAENRSDRGLFTGDNQITVSKMDEMILTIGLDHAVNYDDAAEDCLEDQIVFLCQSPSGHYKAYGFISPEYGRQGILIDNVIDHESNHNYFLKKWVHSPQRPSLRESEDFYQVVFTICQEQEKGMEEVRFSTYDTGTMSAGGWEQMQ